MSESCDRGLVNVCNDSGRSPVSVLSGIRFFLLLTGLGYRIFGKLFSILFVAWTFGMT